MGSYHSPFLQEPCLVSGVYKNNHEVWAPKGRGVLVWPLLEGCLGVPGVHGSADSQRASHVVLQGLVMLDGEDCFMGWLQIKHGLLRAFGRPLFGPEYGIARPDSPSSWRSETNCLPPRILRTTSAVYCLVVRKTQHK